MIMKKAEFNSLLEFQIDLHREQGKKAEERNLFSDYQYHKGAEQALVWALRAFNKMGSTKTYDQLPSYIKSCKKCGLTIPESEVRAGFTTCEYCGKGAD